MAKSALRNSYAISFPVSGICLSLCMSRNYISTIFNILSNVCLLKNVTYLGMQHDIFLLARVALFVTLTVLRFTGVTTLSFSLPVLLFPLERSRLASFLGYRFKKKVLLSHKPNVCHYMKLKFSKSFPFSLKFCVIFTVKIILRSYLLELFAGFWQLPNVIQIRKGEDLKDYVVRPAN